MLRLAKYPRGGLRHNEFGKMRVHGRSGQRDQGVHVLAVHASPSVRGKPRGSLGRLPDNEACW